MCSRRPSDERPIGIPPLLVRADATPDVGMGHVMRCATLARTWRERGGTIAFVGRCDDASLLAYLHGLGIPMTAPSGDPSRDLTTTLERARNLVSGSVRPWILVDGYGFTPDYHRTLRAAGFPVAAFDDSAHLCRYDVDVVINQNLHAPTLAYRTAGDTRLLLGLRYVMLRPEIQQARRRLDETDADPSVVRRVLVAFGGSDPAGLSTRCLAALDEAFDGSVAVDVAVGPVCRTVSAIREQAARSRNAVTIHQTIAEFGSLASSVQMAVSAAGSTVWELAHLGIPMVVTIVADNQSAIAEHLASAGAAVSIGRPDAGFESVVGRAVTRMAADATLRRGMAATGRSLVDGCGADRVCDELLGKDGRRRATE